MTLTFAELRDLLTPDADGNLSVAGAAFDTPPAATLFTTYLADGRLTLSGASATADPATSTVTVNGTLATASFLAITSASTTAATFVLDADGSVEVFLPIAVGDDDWTPLRSFPSLSNTSLGVPSYAKPVLTLSVPPRTVLPAGFRADYGFPADYPAVESAIVKGLSISATVDFGDEGLFGLLDRLGVVGGTMTGPVETVLANPQPDQSLIAYPQLLLSETRGRGSSIAVGSYTLTFAAELIALLQEYGLATSPIAEIGLLPSGGTGLVAQLTPPSGSSIPGFQIAAVLFAADGPPQLTFQAEPLPGDSYSLSDLAGVLNGNSPAGTLQPGHDFNVPDVVTLESVWLTVGLDSPPSLTAMGLEITVGKDQSWKAFDILVFDGIALSVTLSNGVNGASLGATADCAAHLTDSDGKPTGVALAGSISFPDLSFRVSLEQTGSLDLKSLIGDVLPLPTITGSVFTLDGDVPNGVYRFFAQIDQQWTLLDAGGVSLSLTEIGVSLGKDPSGVSGGVFATMEVCGVAVLVSANYEAGGIWTFSGSSTPGASATLADLLTFAAKLIGVEIPDGLPAVDIDQISVSYTTGIEGAAGTLSFTAQVSVQGASANLADLPLVGAMLGDDFELALEAITFSAQSGTDGSVELSFAVAVGTDLQKQIVIPLSSGGGGRAAAVGDDGVPTRAAAAAEPGLPLVVGRSAAGSATTPTYPAAGDGEWFDVQRAFGPVTVEKVGFKLAGGGVSAQMNASLALSAIEIDVLGLGVVVPLSAPYVPSFTIAGLALSYSTPSLAISGGLATPDEGRSFSGGLSVHTPTLSLTAFGQYTTGSPPSFYGYAICNYPLGGPPAFFVTGLAGGMGFNRGLSLPDVADVASFPLVAGAMGTGPFGKDPTIDQFIAKMGPYCPAQTGQYWLALGVAFTSFEIVNSFALVTVAFGAEFEVGLLGKSVLSVPPGEPLVYAELGVKATFTPADGLFSVAAQLTPASYVLDPDCHLTGGFAFYLWFAPNANAGDFVVTLGGYNPYFRKPDHYPTVPALGIRWNVSGAPLTITGKQYMALTPHALMTGGYLNATWSTGPISAWFNVQADFLIGWAPFHYLTEVGVDFGVAAKIDAGLTTLSIDVNVGANLRLVGPPFSGEARIHLNALSFTIHFGDEPGPPTVSWSDFKAQFLPPEPPSPAMKSRTATCAPPALMTNTAKVPVVEAAPAQGSGAVGCVLTSGMVTDLTRVDQVDGIAFPVQYLVDPKTLGLTIQTVIPAATLDYNGVAQPRTWSDGIGIGPMQLDSFTNDLAVTLTYKGDDYTGAKVVPTPKQAAPSALWAVGTDLNGPRLLDDVLVEVAIVPDPGRSGVTQPVAVKVIADSLVDAYALALAADTAPSSDPYGGLAPDATIIATIADAAVATTRGSIVADLLRGGMPPQASLDVAAITEARTLGYLGKPVLRLLGEALSPVPWEA